MPCRIGGDPDLWFSEAPAHLERAKLLCGGCPIRSRCLSDALDRGEPWGVWGGEIVLRGVVIARKRGRGRPRTSAAGCSPMPVRYGLHVD
ncbi:WhiB family transcriptional regulator [Prescottella agglutinans]|uniref:WhiB family transcriptional regulator n=1 Tax=Prescottella agglutinans TaxID=1644129 RepID=UPI0024752346|nr:WhiB family transcriptional regulator [Prescottella agglutinans]